MSAETPTAIVTDTDAGDVLAGVVGGLVGGVVFGLIAQTMLGVMPAIGALYGMPTVTAGWVAHLFHSAVFGLIYAGIANVDGLYEYANDWKTGGLLGMGYGVVLWFVFIIFVWPIWLNAVNFPKAPPVPYVAPKPLVPHLAFGLLLGAVYAALE